MAEAAAPAKKGGKVGAIITTAVIVFIFSGLGFLAASYAKEKLMTGKSKTEEKK